MKRVRAPRKRIRATEKIARRIADIEKRKPGTFKKKKRRPSAPRAKKPPPRTVGILDALDEAFAEIEDLAQEMREWADNLEDKFSGTQKYEIVSSTADTLEGIENAHAGFDDATNEVLNKITIVIQDPTPRRRGYSRADRNADACTILQSISDALDEATEEQLGAHVDDANGLKDDVDAAVSELEGVEFPGAYG